MDDVRRLKDQAEHLFCELERIQREVKGTNQRLYDHRQANMVEQDALRESIAAVDCDVTELQDLFARLLYVLRAHAILGDDALFHIARESPWLLKAAGIPTEEAHRDAKTS